jgi:hypothetical protein
MSVRRAIPRADAITLWTRAYGICSFPDCERELIQGSTDARTRGHIAHIVASRDAGPRGDPSFPPERRNRYDNLILLCPNHHTEIDGEPENYDLETLREMKRAHEAAISARLGKGAVWQQKLATLDYVNVPRLLTDPAAVGVLEEEKRGYLTALTTLRDQGQYLPAISYAFEQVFTAWQAHAVDLDAIDRFGVEAIGARVSFSETFWTKNMNRPETRKPGFQLSGEVENDPHIYLKKAGRRIYLPLDPRWVTTSTAFHSFESGTSRFAGIGTLKVVRDDVAIVSPLAVGSPPLSPSVAAFYDALSVG